MRSKNNSPKPTMIRNWLRDWAAIDLTVLPTGIALAYFLNSNVADGFWFNLSTELIGAYISVRFIDYLLKRSENKHARRRGVARDIMSFADHANEIAPNFDEFLLVTMKNESKVFEDYWKKSDTIKKLLYEDELREIEIIRENRKKIIKFTEKYIENYKILRQIEMDINSLKEHPVKSWKHLQDQFNYFKTTKIASKSGILQSLKKVLDELSELPIQFDGINFFEEYAKVLRMLIDERSEIEKEIQNHIEICLILKHNIYQESG